RMSSDKKFGAPHIMRLAAQSVITHKFDEKLIEQGWSKPQLYKFTTGILDGYRNFMREALLDEYQFPSADTSDRLHGSWMRLPEEERIALPDEERAQKIKAEFELQKIGDYAEKGFYPTQSTTEKAYITLI